MVILVNSGTPTDDIFKDIKQNISILTVIRVCWNRAKRRRGLLLSPSTRNGSSFSVSPGKAFYCFGCGAGGDAVAFVSQLHGRKPIEAAKLIAQDFGLAVMPTLAGTANQDSGTAKTAGTKLPCRMGR